MADKQAFGALLSGYLEAKGMKAIFVAQRMNVHRSTVARWCSGALLPQTLSDVERLADVLGLSDEASRDGLFDAAGFLYRASPTAEDTKKAVPESSIPTASAVAGRAPTISLDTARTLVASLPLSLPRAQPLPPGSRMPFSAHLHFVGRTTLLEAVAAQLGGLSNRVLVAVVTGIGGVGKTQFATEFVHRYGYYFAGGVFWLNFAEVDGIPAAIASCGVGGGLALRPDFHTLPLEEQVALVQQAWQSAMPRLLVFDSCEDEALFERWCPTSGGCRVLVTSKSSVWSSTLGVEVFPLNALSRAESVALLTSYRPDLAGRTELEEIASVLGDLPLALHLAGSFLKTYQHQPHLSHPRRYLERLHHHNLLDHGSLRGVGAERSPTQHDLHVARTFAVSYDRLDDTHTPRLARALLVRAACLAPGEPIPRELLLATIGYTSEEDDLLQFEAAIHECLALGLFTQDTTGALMMHSLIARFVIDREKDDAALNVVEQVLVTEANRVNQGNDPYLLRPWHGHLRHVTLNASAHNSVLTAQLAHELGVYLDSIGDYNGASSFLTQALTLREKTNAPSPIAMAQSRYSLGQLYYHQGHVTEARAQLESALALQEVALGPTHLDTLHTLNTLGRLLARYDAPESAQPYLVGVLKRVEAVCGGQHPLTAHSLNNLGLLHYRAGALQEARAPLEQALAIRQAVLGPLHPDTASSLNNVGVLLHQLGEHAGAFEHYQRTLEVTESRLGHEHPDTAQTLNNMGLVLQKDGRWEEARSYLEEALAIREATLGPTHPDTGHSLNNLGTVLDQMGFVAEALASYQRALAIFEPLPPLYQAERHQIQLNIVALRFRQTTSIRTLNADGDTTLALNG